MELKIVRVRIIWEVTRGGLRPTWSLWQTDALSFVFLVNAGPYLAKSMHEEHLCVVTLTSMERGTQFFLLASYRLV